MIPTSDSSNGSVIDTTGDAHGPPTHILFLTHGFNTFGQWDAILKHAFRTEDAFVAVPPTDWTLHKQRRRIPGRRFALDGHIIMAGTERLLIKSIPYDYLDLLCFLIPAGTRGYVQRSIHRELDATIAAHPTVPYSIIAHSFGTFAVWNLLTTFSRITPDYLVLVGSIVRPARSEHMRDQWRVVASRVRKALVNEVGLKDLWPLLAPMASCGFGNSGRYGSDASLDNVFDRYHPSGTHSNWYEDDDGATIRDWWLPIFNGDITIFAEHVQRHGRDFDKSQQAVIDRLNMNTVLGLVYRTLSILKPGLLLLAILVWGILCVALTVTSLAPALIFGDTHFTAASSLADLESLSPGKSSSDAAELADWSRNVWRSYLVSGITSLRESNAGTHADQTKAATNCDTDNNREPDRPAPLVVEFGPLRMARPHVRARLSSAIPLAADARLDGCAFQVRTVAGTEVLQPINLVAGRDVFSPYANSGDTFRLYLIATADADGNVFPSLRSEELDEWNFILEVEPWTIRDAGEVFVSYFCLPLRAWRPSPK